MITMEFDEMKKIWDTQNNVPLYVLDEKAFHKHVTTKQRKVHHTTNLSELVIMIVYILGCGIIVGVNIVNGNDNIYMYLLAGWMLITAIGVAFGRYKRIRGQKQFDRSILGDLNHEIAVATYQVLLSGIMRWNTIPIALFTVLGVWFSGKSFVQTIAMLIFFAVTYYVSGWEHNYYKSRKKEVEALKKIALSE